MILRVFLGYLRSNEKGLNGDTNLLVECNPATFRHTLQVFYFFVLTKCLILLQASRKGWWSRHKGHRPFLDLTSQTDLHTIQSDCDVASGTDPLPLWVGPMVLSKLSVLTPVKVNSSSKKKRKKKRCNALRTGARIGTLEVDQSWSRYKRNIGVWKLPKQNEYIIHLRLSVRLSIFCHCKNYFSQAEFSNKGSF